MLSHVLEHIIDVQGAVAGLRSLVKPGGLVYIEVPDAARYHDHLVAPFHDFNTEHINHFSVGTLKRLFASRGWKIVAFGSKAISSSPTAKYPCAWILAELAAPGEPVEEMPADRSLHVQPYDDSRTYFSR